MAEPVKIAVPVIGDRVSPHFGHPECFVLVSVDLATRQVLGEQRFDPPPHEPGVLPAWLAEKGVGVVLAGGIGPRAVDLLQGRGIQVATGVPELGAGEAVRRWLDGNLGVRDNPCDHHGHAGRSPCRD